MLWRLFRRSWISAYQHDQFGIAKGAAYSALLSFFPLLATTATILVQMRADFVYRVVRDFLAEIVPPGTGELVFHYFAVKGAHPALLPVTGIAVSLWAASGIMTSLMEGFRAAYGISSGRSFLRERIVAILLVFSAAIPVLAASVLMLLGARVEHWVGSWLGVIPAGEELRGWLSMLGVVLRYLVSMGAIVLGAAILYYFGPNRRQRWSRVWPGAIVATLLWLGATALFAWYVRNIANYNVLYGSIATVIALLVWMYLLAVIAFVGCEFNAQMERGSG